MSITAHPSSSTCATASTRGAGSLWARTSTRRCSHGTSRCSGSSFPWTVAMLAGTQVCLRKVESRAIFDAMRAHGVDHYCAAPIVHNMLVNAEAALREGLTRRVRGMVAGAAPPAAMIEGMARIGFELTHAYGLTETYGPAAVA